MTMIPCLRRRWWSSPLCRLRPERKHSNSQSAPVEGAIADEKGISGPRASRHLRTQLRLAGASSRRAPNKALNPNRRASIGDQSPLAPSSPRYVSSSTALSLSCQLCPALCSARAGLPVWRGLGWWGGRPFYLCWANSPRIMRSC
jgi:hypothetical protein